MADPVIKLTPFSSRVKEIARNFKILSHQVDGVMEDLSDLSSFMTDLIILADELGPEQEELQNIADVVQHSLGSTQVIMDTMTEARDLAIECSEDLEGEMGLGSYLERKVTTPYDPIFTPELKESSQKKKDMVGRILKRSFNRRSKK